MNSFRRVVRNVGWNGFNVAVAVLAVVYSNPYAVNVSKFLAWVILLGGVYVFMTDALIRKALKNTRLAETNAFPAWHCVVSCGADWICLSLYAATGRWFAATVYFLSLISYYRVKNAMTQETNG